MQRPEWGRLMDVQAVQRDILLAFEYSYSHDDWVYPLADALAGVTAQEALWKPGPGVKGIWDIVLHMTAWTDNIGQRIQGRNRCRPPEGAWPPLPAILDEMAWEEAQQRLWGALNSLRTLIEVTPPTVLLDCPDEHGSFLADLLCRFIHNAYHIGQITKMRECMVAPGATVE